ncbi:MAG TPA: hypothetical protein VGN37_10670 [Actinocatenispora sp.]
MISDVAHTVLTALPLSDTGAHLTGLAAPKTVDTSGIISFLASKIAPILLAVLGLIFIGRANKGEVSRVLTSSVIAIVGLVFIGGAVTLLFLGGYLTDLIFK